MEKELVIRNFIKEGLKAVEDTDGLKIILNICPNILPLEKVVHVFIDRATEISRDKTTTEMTEKIRKEVVKGFEEERFGFSIP